MYQKYFFILSQIAEFKKLLSATKNPWLRETCKKVCFFFLEGYTKILKGHRFNAKNSKNIKFRQPKKKYQANVLVRLGASQKLQNSFYQKVVGEVDL